MKCWHISSLFDAEVQYLDKQKIHDLVGGSITIDGSASGAALAAERSPPRRGGTSLLYLDDAGGSRCFGEAKTKYAELSLCIPHGLRPWGGCRLP